VRAESARIVALQLPVRVNVLARLFRADAAEVDRGGGASTKSPGIGRWLAEIEMGIFFGPRLAGSGERTAGQPRTAQSPRCHDNSILSKSALISLRHRAQIRQQPGDAYNPSRFSDLAAYKGKIAGYQAL
jgi:hypothetical protein